MSYFTTKCYCRPTCLLSKKPSGLQVAIWRKTHVQYIQLCLLACLDYFKLVFTVVILVVPIVFFSHFEMHDCVYVICDLLCAFIWCIFFCSSIFVLLSRKTEPQDISKCLLLCFSEMHDRQWRPNHFWVNHLFQLQNSHVIECPMCFW